MGGNIIDYKVVHNMAKVLVVASIRESVRMCLYECVCVCMYTMCMLEYVCIIRVCVGEWLRSSVSAVYVCVCKCMRMCLGVWMVSVCVCARVCMLWMC